MVVVNQIEQLETVLSTLASTNNPISIDTETSWTDIYEDRYCLGISIAHEDDHWYIPVGHRPLLGKPQDNIPFLPIELFDKIRDKIIVMHNAKFDLHVLRGLGFIGEFPNLMDSMLMSHYIDENSLHDLDTLAARYSPVKKNTELAKILKTQLPYTWDNSFIFGMDQYAQEDALSTLHVFKALDRMFDPYREAWEKVDRPFLYLLLDIEAKGIRLDKQKCAELEILCRQRMKQIQQELGFDPAKPAILRSKLFSDPPLGLGLKPASYTPKTSLPQVNTAFLESANHPTCGLILEYKQNQKQASSYFRNYLTIVGDGDRLHPTFKMHGTVTGRLSCENPNLQQIPRDSYSDSAIKKMFLPEEGKQIWEIDFSNIELRLAAVYSQQPDLLKAFSEDQDIHQQVADRLGITRQVAKMVNFLVFYGGGPESLAYKAKIPFREARKAVEATKRSYPEVFAAADEAERVATKTGQIRLFSGRVRHFKYKWEYRKAWNAIIQGGAFEIVKRSMLKLAESDRDFDQRLTVHDSVWVFVDEEAEVKEAEKVMSAWTKEDFGLLFSVESKRLR